ncbi:hypothetical protein EYF80_059754 [Liparis tanakae]|uniref:Uncharacterized protein n=1 Tax=Liparis tanakae TaxID=230148 RepID=A0A4Z2EMU5_9TELE|nr:hypothetical protein EYF80_059754 [Liparis tanakae]
MSGEEVVLLQQLVEAPLDGRGSESVCRPPGGRGSLRLSVALPWRLIECRLPSFHLCVTEEVFSSPSRSLE